jgi:hypothetical protein
LPTWLGQHPWGVPRAKQHDIGSKSYLPFIQRSGYECRSHNLRQLNDYPTFHGKLAIRCILDSVEVKPLMLDST